MYLITYERSCRGDSLDLDSAKAGDYYKNGPHPFRYTLHLASGRVEKECLTPMERSFRCEFPVVAGAAYGHKQKYAWVVNYNPEDIQGDGGIDECVPTCTCVLGLSRCRQSMRNPLLSVRVQ
jgi:carotenoid cleavage dioxygenase-like enzyme